MTKSKTFFIQDQKIVEFPDTIQARSLILATVSFKVSLAFLFLHLISILRRLISISRVDLFFSTSQLYEFCIAVANCSLQINTRLYARNLHTGGFLFARLQEVTE